VGDYRDESALAEFASRIDVATFDFENVPAASAEWLAQRVPVHPGPEALATAQDRLAEKTLFRELGIPLPEFADVPTREALDAAVAAIGAPGILKTRRLGYDGKGQYRIRTLGDVGPAWDALGAQAHAHARSLAERLDYVGVFALELFCRDGVLLANEMAPRVHNSGHWTIEGAETSQFENHLRAVLGLPLGDTRMLGHACMLNWIGEMPEAGAVLREAGGHWHDYGKQPRAGRKVGHATLRAPDAEALAAALAHVGAALGRDAQVEPVIARLRD
jgi:5-(carboxyamino)imidazole ribonucleotide synthase